VASSAVLRSRVTEGDPAHAAAPAPAAALQVLRWPELDEPAAIAAWDNLADHASEPNPFYESWYLLPSLRALDPECEAEVLVLTQGDCWIGLVPLARWKRYYGRPLANISSWVHANCFLGLPLVRHGHEAQFWRAFLSWTDRHCGSSLFLHLTQLPLEGPTHAALAAVLSETGRSAALVQNEARALLRTDLDPTAYFDASLSGKKRKELRRQHARLSELGELRFERSDDSEALDEWIDQFLALERAGWKGSAGSALACTDATAALFCEALTGAAAHGKLERLTFSLDGRPVAMLANFLCASGGFSYKTTYAEDLARFSPGVLLQRENLAILARDGIRWCDSCAAADHPMIDHIWRERRKIGRVSIAIGGTLRRAAFKLLARLETGRRTLSLEN